MVEHLEEHLLRQLYADPASAARQARDKLAAARVWLMKHKPFFGVLARALRLEPTLEVAGFRLLPDDRLRVNSIVVLQARFPAVCARLAHVSLHAALAAFGRRREREPRRWNVAHDLAINPLLDAAGLSVGVPLAPGFAELPARGSAELYFDLLPEGTSPDPLWCDLSDPEASDEAPPAGTYTRQDGGDQPEGDQRDGPSGEGEGEGGESSDDENALEGDAPRFDAAAPLALPGASAVDTRARELQWKMRLAAAYEEELASGGKTFGDMPGWIDELVRATIEPPADWSITLQQAVSSLHRTNRTYLRPSRRMSALVGADGSWPDVVSMPGRRVEQAGQLVAVVDTSSSISAETLSRFFGVVASVATAEGIDEVRLLQADAIVTADRTVYAAELLFEHIAITGRGGTDFSAALHVLTADARRLVQRFTVAYLTDLEGRFPARHSDRFLDLLWVVPQPPACAPPFGRVVVMHERRDPGR